MPGASASLARPAPTPARDVVLTGATLRAAELLGVSQSRLAQVLGVSAPTVSRMKSGAYRLDEARKEWALATLFVRLYRSLDSVVAGRGEDARAWLSSPNQAFAGRNPGDMIGDVQGLVHVVDYLDAARGRN
jgi:uncharacterized protein (DUF2384 family)